MTNEPWPRRRFVRVVPETSSHQPQEGNPPKGNGRPETEVAAPTSSEAGGEEVCLCVCANLPEPERKPAWEWFDDVQKKIATELKLVVKRRGKKHKW